MTRHLAHPDSASAAAIALGLLFSRDILGGLILHLVTFGGEIRVIYDLKVCLLCWKVAHRLRIISSYMHDSKYNIKWILLSLHIFTFTYLSYLFTGCLFVYYCLFIYFIDWYSCFVFSGYYVDIVQIVYRPMCAFQARPRSFRSPRTWLAIGFLLATIRSPKRRWRWDLWIWPKEATPGATTEDPSVHGWKGNTQWLNHGRTTSGRSCSSEWEKLVLIDSSEWMVL